MVHFLKAVQKLTLHRTLNIKFDQSIFAECVPKFKVTVFSFEKFIAQFFSHFDWQELIIIKRLIRLSINYLQPNLLTSVLCSKDY